MTGHGCKQLEPESIKHPGEHMKGDRQKKEPPVDPGDQLPTYISIGIIKNEDNGGQAHQSGEQCGLQSLIHQLEGRSIL
jgi:hypothetical protein